LTALYFIYYIEFMSLCCHDQFSRAKLSLGPVCGADQGAPTASGTFSAGWDVCLCHYCQVSI